MIQLQRASIYTMESLNYPQRAKVYRLNDEGNWDDRGTGHVSVEYLECIESPATVLVVDEGCNSTLLVHRISPDDIYRRTEDTIISWRDPDIATELALSFQETICCSNVWDQICDVQRKCFRFPAVIDGEVMELPPVEISSLRQILKIVSNGSLSFLDRDQVASSLILKNVNFLNKLIDLFRSCEEQEDIEALHVLFGIAKAIILLNDGHIFDIIFSDKFIMGIIGMLEYDPEVASRQKHRTFLKEQVIFKEVIPIPQANLLSKIHQTYKISYIKDVILPNILDNLTLSTLNSIILSNNIMVVSGLLNDAAFMKHLFKELKCSENNDKRKKDLVHFLQEFCTLSKSLQMPLRSQLFRCFVNEGLFDVVTDLLSSSDEILLLSGTDILTILLNYDASLLRSFLMDPSGQKLSSLLVKGMLYTSPSGVHTQLLEVMRILLDCETTERIPLPAKNPFLEVFYAKYMDEIIKTLVTSPNDKVYSVSVEIIGNICELLSFCVQHHGYLIKHYVVRNQVMEKVLHLTMRREKHLAAGAVRFLRTCIAQKEEFYYQYIVKHDLFRPVVTAFTTNGNRYNLLNSCILDLFNSIIKANIKSLIVYLFEKYYKELEGIDYVNTFKMLKDIYDQGMIQRDQASFATSSGEKGVCTHDDVNSFLQSRWRKDERALDKDEEEYFNEDSASDDEEDTASAESTISTGLPSDATMKSCPLSDTYSMVNPDDEDEFLPSTSRNDISENENFSPATLVAFQDGYDEAKCFNHQEDEVIQIVKRKIPPAPEISANELDTLKKIKSTLEESCSSEESFSTVEASSEGKAETSTSDISQDDIRCLSTD